VSNNINTNAHTTTAELERDNQMHIDDDIIRIMREMATFEAQCKIHHREKRHRDYYVKNIHNRVQQQKIQRTYNNTRHK
jgi:hypothetical protein